MPWRSYRICKMVEWQWRAEIDLQNSRCFVLGKCWLSTVVLFCNLFSHYFKSSKIIWWYFKLMAYLCANLLIQIFSWWGGPSELCFNFFTCVLLCVSVEPMRTPKRLKIAETRSRLIAVDWESLGYNITRCHTFNVTICYHYMTANNHSKADCLDMDPKGNT